MSVRSERDYNSFLEVAPTSWARRVTVAGSLLEGVSFDEITATYPDPLTEVYTYNLAATTVATITVTFLAPNKEQIGSVVRT